MNPRTTFTELSQLPLLSFLSREGNIAKIVKGRANATEKASIVTIGVQNSPWVDLMRTEPTIGPVQENDTRTRVRAMKKMPASPPLSELRSLLLTNDEGSVISNAPKNEAANTMNTMKKMMFGSQWVASQLNMSAVTVSPPKSHVRPMMMEIGNVYRSTMKRPYIEALNLPAAGVDEPFMKKDMVMGTIGKTQGVRSIAKPQRIASSIRPQMDVPFSLSSAVMAALSPPAFFAAGAAAVSAGLLSFSSKS